MAFCDVVTLPPFDLTKRTTLPSLRPAFRCVRFALRFGVRLPGGVGSGSRSFSPAFAGVPALCGRSGRVRVWRSVLSSVWRSVWCSVVAPPTDCTRTRDRAAPSSSAATPTKVIQSDNSRSDRLKPSANKKTDIALAPGSAVLPVGAVDPADCMLARSASNFSRRSLLPSSARNAATRGHADRERGPSIVWQSPTLGSANKPPISARTVADGLTPASVASSASIRSRWPSTLLATLASAVRCATDRHGPMPSTTIRRSSCK